MTLAIFLEAVAIIYAACAVAMAGLIIYDRPWQILGWRWWDRLWLGTVQVLLNSALWPWVIVLCIKDSL